MTTTAKTRRAVAAWLPAVAKVGQCENLFRGQRDDWRDARYCDAPVLNLGGTTRNICQACRADTSDWMAEVRARWSAGLIAEGKHTDWLEGNAAMLDFEYDYLGRRAAARAPMAELLKIRHGISVREELAAAVGAALAAVSGGAQ